MVQYFPCDKRLLSFSTDTHRQRCIIPLYRYFFLRVGHKHGRVADVFQKGQNQPGMQEIRKVHEL